VAASGAKGLTNGMRVDVLLKADGSTGAAGVVGAEIEIDTTVSPHTVTLQGGKTLLAYATVNGAPTTFGIYRAGSWNDSIWGLDAAIGASDPARGPYLGISRTTNAFWKGQRLYNTSAPGTPVTITLPRIQEGIDAVEINSMGKPNLIIMSHAVWNTVANILVGNKRYEGNMMKLNGWCTAVEFAGIPMVRDKHCPPNKIYILDTTKFRLWGNDEGDWMDKDGAILSRIQNRYAYEATWRRSMQLACEAPGANCIIEDVAA